LNSGIEELGNSGIVGAASSRNRTSDPGQQASGIYLHIPFCRAKCPYCDFYSVTRLDRIKTFIRALITELALGRQPDLDVDTVYIGGGTPSLLAPRQIEQLLDAVLANFSVSSDAEVTLEVNPGTVNRGQLDDLGRVGVNRLNIGLQSIDDRTLDFLGRIHSARAGIAAYQQARAAGFDNVGLDLIYAIPGQRIDTWQRELAQVAGLLPEHLSCYTLTIEPGTPLARQVDSGQIEPLDEQAAGDLFLATADVLDAYGYHHYEISNFARRTDADHVDRRSRHNCKYWNFVPYLGFGPSAHSFVEPTRWWNHANLDDYLTTLASGKLPVAGREVLTREQQMIEFIYLGLRQTAGMDLEDFAERFGAECLVQLGPQLVRLDQEGLAERSASRVRLTRQGMRFLDSVVGSLLD
jgi:oxygen-independent coproporphyrinogen-3 oxidase